jgi:methionine-rich copper-binding protein CopC
VASGDYDLRAVVTDVAGNAFTTAIRTVTVDSTPPPVSALTVASLLSGTKVLRVATTSDASKATYGVTPAGGSTWSQIATSTTGPSFDGSFDTTTVTDGLYDVRAKVSDQFGNTTTVVVNNVRVDNTVPAVVTESPVDGSVVSSVSTITLDASEDVSAVTSLKLDGVVAGFTPSISGANVSFPVGTLAPGNHALTGRIVDVAGLSAPFRINLTIPMTTGDVAPTSKNVGTVVPTSLGSADGAATVNVPSNVWQQAAPVAQDFLVLHIEPTPASAAITGNLRFASMVVNVRMTWNLAGWDEHHFDAPLEIVLTDSSGGFGYPVTYESGAWRDIPLLDTAGVLPASWQDGYWRDHGAVHILTRHLSLFALVNSLGTMQLAPPRDFAGVVAADGLTLRWAPGMDQLANYLLYVDGRSTRLFGPTEVEGKLGPISADMDRRYTLTETNFAGRESGHTTALRVVPPVVGLTVAEAMKALAGRTFVLGKKIPVYAPQVPVGTVVGPSDVQVLAEGSAVDVQIATQSIVRSAFAFSAAHAPRLQASRHALTGRALITGRARIDVTLDARPYVRIQRWHFFHVKAGATMIQLPIARGLAPGLYRLYWKATSEADHSVRRLVTPLVILGPKARPHTAKPPKVVVVGTSLRSTQAVMPRLGVRVEQVTGEQLFLYATYHDVSVIVVDADVTGVPYIRALHKLFPSTAIVARSAHAARRAVLSRLDATAVPASMPAAQLAALVQKLAKR